MNVVMWERSILQSNEALLISIECIHLQSFEVYAYTTYSTVQAIQL